jgi:hypothetical protein
MRASTANIAALAALVAAAAHAQWINLPTPGIPRTPDGKPNLSAPAPKAADGKPDLSGLWYRISPKYGRNIAADLKPGEIQPWAEALVQQRKENLGKDYMNTLCLPLGPSYTTSGDGTTSAGMMKIVQTPTLIIILNPDLTYRQIYLDGRALEPSPNPNWMGYSVGRWEGDTLVVDSFGFNDRTWLDAEGHPHTEALRTTERYRRRNFGNLDLEVTLSDPSIYARPWTVKVQAELAADTSLLEYVCNENNKNREHWVGKASDEKRTEVKVAPEILAKYVGTYEEQPKLWSRVPRIVQIAVSGDALMGDLDGRGMTRLTAQSETEFTGFFGLGIEFVKNDQGAASQLFVKHVSGNYRFLRKK